MLAVAFGGIAGPAQAATPKLKILPLGDSITWGYGSTTGSGYRGDLYNSLTGAGYSVDYVGSQKSGSLPDPDNEGHPSWRIDQIAAIATSTMTTYQPNIVLLHLGTNDMSQNYKVSTAPDRLGALIDQIRASSPTVTVIVASLVTSKNAATRTRIIAYNKSVSTLVQQRRNAGQHLVFASMAAVTTADLYDSLHPNDNGYQKMSDAFYSGIQQAVSAGWVQSPGSTGGGGTAGAGALKGQESGLCVDVPNVSKTDGTHVALWSCNGGTNQSWASTSSKQLKVYGTKCLAAAGTANGAAVEISTCTTATSQQWTLNSSGTIVNVQSGLCLDAAAHGKTNGTVVDLWSCNGGTNQKWTHV